MSNKQIILKQATDLGSFSIGFYTNPKISNEILDIFYNDISNLIKKLDMEINYEGEVYVNIFENRLSYFFLSTGLFRYMSLSKSLQAKKDPNAPFSIENIIRTYNIDYRRKPKGIEDFKDLYELVRKSDNLFKSRLLFKPNIQIDIINPVLELSYWVEKISEFDNVGRDDPNNIILVCDPKKLLQLNQK